MVLLSAEGMRFERITDGYYMAESDTTGDSYVIRTRPLNDGWMAINDDEGIVIGTGLSQSDAMSYCASYDKLVNESITYL
jgi:hypothetical protein